MKNILILTDFSNNSWNSIMYALALFQNKRCNFYLLNAVSNPEEKFKDLMHDKRILSNVHNRNKEFDKLIDKVSSLPLKGNHEFIPILAETTIIEAARLQIREKNIQLIVIGTSGMSSNGKGNNISPNSEDIITKLKCSTLVVPNEARFNGLKKIAFPTDYTNFYEAKLLENIINLFSQHESSISFVHMAKKTEELNKEQLWNKETLQDYFSDRPHSFHTEVNKNFELSIESFIEKSSIDLIVMAAKNLNLFEQILFRPKIKNVHYYFKTPFLVLHQPNY